MLKARPTKRRSRRREAGTHWTRGRTLGPTQRPNGERARTVPLPSVPITTNSGGHRAFGGPGRMSLTRLRGRRHRACNTATPRCRMGTGARASWRDSEPAARHQASPRYGADMSTEDGRCGTAHRTDVGVPFVVSPISPSNMSLPPNILPRVPRAPARRRSRTTGRRHSRSPRGSAWRAGRRR